MFFYLLIPSAKSMFFTALACFTMLVFTNIKKPSENKIPATCNLVKSLILIHQKYRNNHPKSLILLFSNRRSKKNSCFV